MHDLWPLVDHIGPDMHGLIHVSAAFVQGPALARPASPVSRSLDQQRRLSCSRLARCPASTSAFNPICSAYTPDRPDWREPPFKRPNPANGSSGHRKSRVHTKIPYLKTPLLGPLHRSRARALA